MIHKCRYFNAKYTFPRKYLSAFVYCQFALIELLMRRPQPIFDGRCLTHPFNFFVYMMHRIYICNHAMHNGAIMELSQKLTYKSYEKVTKVMKLNKKE